MAKSPRSFTVAPLTSGPRGSLLAAVLALLVSAGAHAGDGGDAFTYQGQLQQSGAAASGPLDLVFRLFNAAEGGTQIGSALTATDFTDFDDAGRFTVELAFGPTAFPGAARWLEITVEGVTLAPRQRINPVPYATRSLEVAQVGSSALIGSYSNALTMTNGANQFGGTFNGTHSGSFTGSGSGLSALNASNISNGTLDGSILTGTYGKPLTMTNAANQFGGTFNGNGSLLTSLSASNVSTGTLSADRLPVPLEISGSNPTSYVLGGINASSVGGSSGVWGHATAISGPVYGGRFVSSSTSGRGVIGYAEASSGTTYGVLGHSQSPSGTAVRGDSISLTGVTYGVVGLSSSPDGRGVVGQAIASTGESYGGRFESASSSGRAVYARATSLSGESRAIDGRVDSPDGYGLYVTGAVGSTNHLQRALGIGISDPLIRLAIGEVGTGLDRIPGLGGGLGLYTAGVMRMRVAESDGKVGIGLGVADDAQQLLSIGGGMNLDQYGANNGTVENSLRFGSFSGEAIASKRTSGGNNFGLDFYTAGINRMVLTNGGSIGIGTTTPGALLEVNGSAAKPGGGAWAVSSDIRLKKDIAPLAHALDDLLRLRGVTYAYIDPAAINELEGARMGFIAQEVEEVFPDWVDEGSRGFKRLTIRGFEALAVEAIRALRAEKDAQLAERDAQLAERDAVIADHQTRLVSMEARMAALEAALNKERSQ